MIVIRNGVVLCSSRHCYLGSYWNDVAFVVAEALLRLAHRDRDGFVDWDLLGLVVPIARIIFRGRGGGIPHHRLMSDGLRQTVRQQRGTCGVDLISAH